MEKVTVQARLRFLRTSAKKVRLVCDAIRGLSVVEADKRLIGMKKKASFPLHKLLHSAVANALNNFDAKKETLKIEAVFADEGPTIKRYRPRARGVAAPIRKRMSHVTIVVSGEKKEKAEEKVAPTKKAAPVKKKAAKASSTKPKTAKKAAPKKAAKPVKKETK